MFHHVYYPRVFLPVPAGKMSHKSPSMAQNPVAPAFLKIKDPGKIPGLVILLQHVLMKKSLLNQCGLIGLLLLLVLTTNAQWVSHGPYGGVAMSVETIGSAVFAGAGHGIYKSTDNGATWTLVSPNNKILWVTDITASGGVIYA